MKYFVIALSLSASINLFSETIYLTCKGEWEKTGTSKVGYKTLRINDSGSVFGELEMLVMDSAIAAKYSNKGKSRGIYMPDKCSANETKVICNSGRQRIDNNSYYTHNLDFNYKDESFYFTLKSSGGGVDTVERHYGSCK